GDKVSISWEGTRFTDVVQAGQITWDSNGRSVSVTIGQRDAQDSPTPPWVRRIRKLESELRTLKGA
ncbi:hypothetical protein ODZ83_11185, partial [Acaricomes phytoseiuli]|uniref:hypothetical protein n=1 Tax=Acaricomes phytoseiuli TaxID=291968 RepID=UPI0022230D9A